MQSRVLILSQPRDVHAFAVQEALLRKGAEVVVWLTSDFPASSRESVHYSGTERAVRIRSPDLELTDPEFTAVWNRRPSLTVDRTLLHEADIAFAELECSYFRKALFSLISPNAFWVNRPEAAIQANRKVLQHQAALEVGFLTPETLYTNDPDQIRTFIADQGGQAVYKPFTSAQWRDEETSWIPFSTLVSLEQLPSDPVLMNVPGIYQALIPKAFELRVTVMGRQALSAKILSQATESGKVDWRKSYHELVMEPVVLEREIEDRCARLLSKLGLVFGCFDLIVTPRGEYVFLEVNEMGQFLFLESRADLPLLDCFSDFLLDANPDFVWTGGGGASVSYGEVSGVASALAERSAEGHVCARESTTWEGGPDGPEAPAS